MEYAIVLAKSKKEIQKLVAAAKELGLYIKIVHNEAFEDLIFAKAIENGETREIVDTLSFLKSLL
jgi:hypothetical protein